MVWTRSYSAITDKLKAKAIQVKTGTVVDATIIASASERRWVKYKGQPAVHGFRVLVEEIAITSTNINDGKAGSDALHGNPDDGFAESAYRGNHFSDAVRAKGGMPRLVTAGCGDGTKLKHRLLEAFNQPIHRIRGRIEKIFGTWKRSYDFRRTLWRGLTKAGVQIRLTAIAYNMKRSLKVAAMAGWRAKTPLTLIRERQKTQPPRR